MIDSMTYPPFPTCLLHLRAKTHSLWPIEGSLFLNQWLSFWAYQWFTLNCTVFSVCITKKQTGYFLSPSGGLGVVLFQCRILSSVVFFYGIVFFFEIFVENTILDLSVIVLIRKWLFATIVLIRYWNTPLSYFSKKKFGDSSIVFIGQCRIYRPVSYFYKSRPSIVFFKKICPVSY